MADSILAQGAEAVLMLEKLDGRSVVVKDRVRKGYRIPELDMAIRKARTRHEESLLLRASRAGVGVPTVIRTEGNSITMEFVDGERVKDAFNTLGERKRATVAGQMGRSLGLLHSSNIMHGDFTTSNMLLKGEGSGTTLFVIDFGLGKYSEKAEDKAVDLYVLFEALKAVHFKYLNSTWQKILKSYRQHYSQAADVLKRLERIEKRRRYKGE